MRTESLVQLLQQGHDRVELLGENLIRHCSGSYIDLSGRFDNLLHHVKFGGFLVGTLSQRRNPRL